MTTFNLKHFWICFFFYANKLLNSTLIHHFLRYEIHVVKWNIQNAKFTHKSDLFLSFSLSLFVKMQVSFYLNFKIRMHVMEFFLVNFFRKGHLPHQIWYFKSFTLSLFLNNFFVCALYGSQIFFLRKIAHLNEIIKFFLKKNQKWQKKILFWNFKIPKKKFFLSIFPPFQILIEFLTIFFCF